VKIIEQNSTIMYMTENPLKLIELAGRTCYKSEDKITDESATKFVEMLANSLKHESVLEHANMTVRFITDRGVTHELVRHRIAGYSQESSRYCAYNKDKYDNQITCIKPVYWDVDSSAYKLWYDSMVHIEETYMSMMKAGAAAQEARAVLPNSLKTEIVMTANFREWRHVFKLRTSKKAHPQIRHLMLDLLHEVQSKVPVVFEGLCDD
jgi:thymidylate synthase (FAD)